MKLRSIETTPNPNCMMLKVDESFGDTSVTITTDDPNLDQAPPVVQGLLAIPGVRSVFLARDFITLTRRGGADWGEILAGAGRLLGAADPSTKKEAVGAKADVDTVELAVLEFRCLPSQVRATSSSSQARVALPDRFTQELARVLDAVSANYLRERSWRALEPRFGDPAEIAQMVADELDSAIPDPLLKRLGAAAIAERAPERVVPQQRTPKDLLKDLESTDWKLRLAAIQVIKIDESCFPAVISALSDPKPSVRRWAAASLGSSGRSEAVASLAQVVVADRSVIVRRAAGDSLSDLANPGAIEAMCQALVDASHLVRWRAARYLNEQGDDTALPALETAIAAEADFGVRLEMTTALERIQSGGESLVPMWLRLARGSKPESQ
jgi:hypothetical protein